MKHAIGQKLASNELQVSQELLKTTLKKNDLKNNLKTPTYNDKDRAITKER